MAWPTQTQGAFNSRGQPRKREELETKTRVRLSAAIGSTNNVEKTRPQKKNMYHDEVNKEEGFRERLGTW